MSARVSFINLKFALDPPTCPYNIPFILSTTTNNPSTSHIGFEYYTLLENKTKLRLFHPYVYITNHKSSSVNQWFRIYGQSADAWLIPNTGKHIANVLSEKLEFDCVAPNNSEKEDYYTSDTYPQEAKEKIHQMYFSGSDIRNPDMMLKQGGLSFGKSMNDLPWIQFKCIQPKFGISYKISVGITLEDLQNILSNWTRKFQVKLWANDLNKIVHTFV